MAIVTVAPSDSQEAATLAACQSRFGKTVVDELVTNWIASHADNFRREQVETLLKAADADPVVATKLAATVVVAQASLDAAAVVKDGAEVSQAVGKFPTE